MEWIEKLNISIEQIENKLARVIDYDEAAKVAYCSWFDFQRIHSIPPSSVRKNDEPLYILEVGAARRCQSTYSF